MASRLSAGAPAGSDRMLFIVEGPSHFPGENRRTAVSHARRWQTSQIHRERRIAAQQGAEYARSLVGWGRAVNASGSIIRPLLPSIPRRAEKDLLEQVAATIPQEICAGLRNDPFDALPVNLTGVGMKMIDYCLGTLRSNHELHVLTQTVWQGSKNGQGLKQVMWTTYASTIPTLTFSGR